MDKWNCGSKIAMLRFGGPILKIVCALAIFGRHCLGTAPNWAAFQNIVTMPSNLRIKC